MSVPEIKIISWSPLGSSAPVDYFLKRPAVAAAAEEAARTVLAGIRTRGDAAIIEYAERFDGSDLSARGLRVGEDEIVAAQDAVDPEFKAAAAETLRRVRAFSERAVATDWSMPTPHGGSVGEKFDPLARVGAYIPGGTAPLVSTALMTIPIAKVAGVPEIVACTPAAADGSVNPYILYALDLAGATEIYRIGGIQAIGAMAYGSETIRPVQKIVGPGGPYVTAAKRQVYGTVGLDMVAGPSEIAILADESANPAHIAADLLSQAEHGSGHEKTLLATTSRSLAEAVAAELIGQCDSLPKRATAMQVLENGTLLAVVESLDDGVELCNRFAPEHMEVMTVDARERAQSISTAGAIFIGPWTPEAAGDFIAGPSHVLPTGGTAAIFSGLTVADFRRRTSLIEFTRADLEATRAAIEVFGRVETLAAHARSASIRFAEEGGE
jgi:histidinol dehydrogenase